MYTFYLKEEDMLEETHFPVIALFNEALNSDILEFYTDIINGSGRGYNYTTYYFWDELDDYEKSKTPSFKGICIETEADEVVTISYEQLYHYMCIATEKYFQSKNRNNTELLEILNEYKKKHLIR